VTPVLAATTAQLVRQGETREVFWHFPAWLEIAWYVVATASVVVFAWGVVRPLAKYLRGNRDQLPPRSELRERLRSAVALTLSHRTIGRRDPYAGFAHAAMFYGFGVLFVGTVVLGLNTDVTERFFGWRFFTGDFYRWYSVILDVMGIALLGGVLAMMLRRGLIRPPKLDYHRPDRTADEPQYGRRTYRWGDWLFVGGLLYLLVTGYVLEALRIAMDHPAAVDYSPVGWAVSRAFTGIPQGTLDVLRMTLWWSHGLVAISFVAAIPYTKAMHMLTSFASLVLRDPLAGKRLAVVPPARQDEPAGYGVLADFSINHLLQLDACTKCGKCHDVCPANVTGRPLSPRDVVLELREDANSDFAGAGIGGVLGTLLQARGGAGPSDAGGLDGRPVVDESRVKPETIWSCMQCNACVEICPVGIEQAPIINQMRRRMVEDGELPAELRATLRTVQKSGNSFGENKRRRGRWTEELDVPVTDARKEPVDVLWFVGDYASFDPRSQRVSRTLARLYQAAGVDFGILYDAERTAGNDIRRIGEEGLWESLAEENIGTLNGAEFSRIVTTDPHSLNTLRNEYPQLGGQWPIDHHTTFLLELLESGRLELKERLSYRVTYHDPCYLGRHNGEYEAPRRILELLGCELVEMPRNRSNSFCCGAGGGQIWTKDQPGVQRPSENRIDEAAGLGELDFFVVACPKDATMFEDAIKTSGRTGHFALRELTELLEEALLGAPVDASAPTLA
jgi:Fe-S oxidoreductase